MCFRQKKLYKLYPFIELVKKLESLTIRARAAYGFLCVENALMHYHVCGEEWNKIVTYLWKYTTLDYGGGTCPLDRWAYNTITNLYIFVRESYEEYISNPYRNYMFPEDILSEEEYIRLQKAVISQGNQVIFDISFQAHLAATYEMDGGQRGVSITTEEIINLVRILVANGIPLPDITPLMCHSKNAKGGKDSDGWGATFDGIKYSKFLQS